jgi:hypothetical protein
MCCALSRCASGAGCCAADDRARHAFPVCARLGADGGSAGGLTGTARVPACATERVQERTGDPARTQRLVYAGYQLAPERSFADYEVRASPLRAVLSRSWSEPRSVAPVLHAAAGPRTTSPRGTQRQRQGPGAWDQDACSRRVSRACAVRVLMLRVPRQIASGATLHMLQCLRGGMPASAPRIKMPANNRMHSSAALRTTDMWSNVIGNDFGKANDAGAPRREERARMRESERVWTRNPKRRLCARHALAPRTVAYLQQAKPDTRHPNP